MIFWPKHIYLLSKLEVLYMFRGQLIRTLAIDSPLQIYPVGLLLEFID